jgi:ABC-type glycerol-3-phosphate transport system substrate-binding protein
MMKTSSGFKQGNRIGLWRRLAIGSASLAVISVAFATGPGGASTPKGGGNISVWEWQAGTSYIPVFQNAAHRYTAQYGGNVNIQSVPFTSYFTKFTTNLDAGSGVPDVMEMSWTGEYQTLAKSGALLPLNKYLTTGFPTFNKAAMGSLTVNGQVYGIPMDMNTLTIAYNEGIFAKLGIKIPTSLAQLIALAAPIRAAGYQPLGVNEMDGWPLPDLWFSQVAYTDPTHSLIFQADDGKSGWNNPQFVKAASNVKSMLNGKLFADGSPSLTLTSLSAAFGQGQVAMMYPAGNFDTSLIDQADNGKFKYALFPFPPVVAGQKPLATGGPAIIWSIPAKSKNPVAALNYIRETVNAVGQAVEEANNFIPSAASFKVPANANPIYKQMTGFQPTAQTRAIFNASVNTALGNAMSGLLSGTVSPKQLGVDLQAAAGK